MIVKVCGMREVANAADVAALGVDMMGFILYDRSPRYIKNCAPETPKGVVRVGVFVNSSLDNIKLMAELHRLDFVQLHGSESVELCRQLRDLNLGVIKAISVSCAEDIAVATAYENEVDYLLFDTKCAEHGGSGKRFDWSVLEAYKGETPFLLSGGIDEYSASEILEITHPKFAGVDLNSRFESAPAVKNIDKLQHFLTKIKNI